jgi:hypothetical protein
LASRKHLHWAILEFSHTNLSKQTGYHFISLFSPQSADTQSSGIFNTLPHRQILIGDAELRDIAEFRWVEILISQIPAIPMDGSLFLTGGDPGDHFQKSAFTATGRADHGNELPTFKRGGDLRKKSRRVLFRAESQGQLIQGEHLSSN